MSEPTIENEDMSKAKLKAFFLPIISVVLITIVLSALTLDVYAGIQENVVTNFDFEQDSENWSVSGTTFGLPAHSGEKSAEITPGGYVAQNATDTYVDDISSFSFWIFDANNASVDFIVYYTDTTTTTHQFSLGNTGLWSQKNITNLTPGKIINKFNITNTDITANINVDDIDLSISAIPDIAPVPGNSGAILSMLFYVVLVFIMGFVVLFLIKKGLMIFLSYFYAIIMGFSWFTFGLFYGGIILTYLVGIINNTWEIIPRFLQNFLIYLFETAVIPGEMLLIEAILYFISALLGLVGTISFGIKSFKRIWVRNLMMVFFGPMIGAMLAIHMGLLTVFFILIGLSLYDIYAVFRGPLKGIIDESRESVKGMEYEIEEEEYEYGKSEVELVPLMPALPVYSTPLISIGLGDFAFFSMFISAAVIISAEISSPIPLLLAVIGLLGGAYYTFQYLKEERALPGLPLPIFGGITLLITGIFIVMVLGGTSFEAILDLFG
ncbi:MAG: hypothetical protein ACW98F_01890 [Candidatus Hodarchaeales archaeon]